MAYKSSKNSSQPQKQNNRVGTEHPKKPIMLTPALTVSGSQLVGQYHFDCGNDVPVFEVHTVHALNQIIGHAKFNNQSYGNVYYRGECKLHPSIKPSLFRDIKNTEKATQRIMKLIQKIADDPYMKRELKIGRDKFDDIKNKIEGMLLNKSSKNGQ